VNKLLAPRRTRRGLRWGQC